MTTTLTKLSLVAFAAVALSTSYATAFGGNGIVNMPIINVPQINVPQGNGNNGNNGIPIIDVDPPSFGPVKPKIPIVILDDGVGSGGPGPRSIPVTNQTQGSPDVGCKVKGPGATTDDIWIINTGDVALPMGSRIRYRVPSTGDHGAFELPRDLAVGQKLEIANLLSNASSGAPCSVRLIT